MHSKGDLEKENNTSGIRSKLPSRFKIPEELGVEMRKNKRNNLQFIHDGYVFGRYQKNLKGGYDVYKCNRTKSCNAKIHHKVCDGIDYVAFQKNHGHEGMFHRCSDKKGEKEEEEQNSISNDNIEISTINETEQENQVTKLPDFKTFERKVKNFLRSQNQMYPYGYDL